ncbi:hypothetical protein K488DRAFT_53034 [Vararia minispora EC-137]|uniref:Uncharacterized protein n=1 Tax=Vararia minispora EC-137 TaxID=1314806 RepID=A0ACB8QGM0_9AGAM|nr:hypothetical protein K488DRAFT_53034 [Vararia minispora EC-137]
MTVAEAQDVIHTSMVWDMRTINSYALSFAIIRTYAIPTISKTLLASGELVNGPQVSKRFLDVRSHVCVFLSAMLTGKIHTIPRPRPLSPCVQDPRAFVGIARMNWLHAHYHISNDDYLYTLSLFVLDPIRWTRNYSWRPLSPLEEHARFILYKYIGELMNIDSIPKTLEELEAWSLAYERDRMVPAETNEKLSKGMLVELSSSLPLPGAAKAFLRGCITVLFPERTRIAMMCASPLFLYPARLTSPQASGANARPARLRTHFPPCLCLHAGIPYAPALLPSADAQELTYGSRTRPVTKPWYIARPRGLRLVLEEALLRLGLKRENDVPGPQYCCEGFRMEEIGPTRWQNVGHEKVFTEAERMIGCPIDGIWGRQSALNGNEVVHKK